MKYNIIIISFLFVIVCPAGAQDAGYWSSGYSAGGFFTPGAVIAFNKDSGQVFVNPALMAWSRTSTATVSANIYQYDNTRIKNGAGTGYHLQATGSTIIPQMVAGCVSLKGKRNVSLGYALLREPVISYNMSQRADKHINSLNDGYSNGEENFIGQLTEQNRISNTSLLVSGAVKLSQYWSAGITLEGRLRRQEYLLGISNRAIYAGASDSLYPPNAAVSSQYSAIYVQSAFRLKLGLSYNHRRHHLGWMFTSPLWRIGGHATLVSDLDIHNLGAPPLSFNLIASTRQTRLPVSYKLPFTAALGYAYDYSSRGQLYIALEYFSAVNRYNVFTPRNEYFLRPDTGNNNIYTSELLKMEDAHKAIWNTALGVSFGITSLTTGYVAARTDFSYVTKEVSRSEYYTPYVADWDNWHLEMGANFRQRKFNLRAGFMFSYAHTRNYLQKVNFDNPDEGNLLQGNVGTTAARRFSAGLLLSYIYNL
jgi:hypothetical protein